MNASYHFAAAEGSVSFPPDWPAGRETVRDCLGNSWLLEPKGADGQRRLVRQASLGHAGGPVEERLVLAAGRWESIVSDGCGFLWAGGEDGLLRLDPREPEKVFSRPGKVSVFGLSPDDRLMFGKPDGGLFDIDVDADGGIEERRLDADGLPKEELSAAAMAPDGSLWAAAGGVSFHAPAEETDWRRNWDSLGRLPWGNHDIYAVPIDGRLYTAAGLGDHGLPAERIPFDAVFGYDPTTDGWETVARLGLPVCYCGLADLEGSLWIIGGFEEAVPGGERIPTDKVSIFSPGTGAIGPGPSLDHPRAEVVALQAGGRIYAVGGDGEGSVCSIGLGEKSWRPEPAAPGPVRQAAGCVLDDNLYVFAGSHQAYRFDTAVGVWEHLPPLPGCGQTPRASLCAAHDGEVWVMGGLECDPAEASWIFNPATGSWRRGPDLPTPLNWGAAAELDGRLILAGGAYFSKRHGYFIFSDRTLMLRED